MSQSKQTSKMSEEIAMLLRELYEGLGWKAPVLLQAATQIEKLETEKSELLEALTRITNEAVLDGLEDNAGWDAWIAQAQELIGKHNG